MKLYTEEQVIDIFEKYGNMSAINARNILYLSESIELPSDDLQSIQLTEEWLITNGFEKSNEGRWRFKGGYHWIEVDLCSVYIHGKQTVLIDYVYQLQNIWLSLTHKNLIQGGNK